MPIALYRGSGRTEQTDRLATAFAGRLDPVLGDAHEVVVASGFSAGGRPVSVAVFTRSGAWIVEPEHHSSTAEDVQSSLGLSARLIAAARLSLHNQIAKSYVHYSPGSGVSVPSIQCRLLFTSDIPRTNASTLGPMAKFCQARSFDQVVREIALATKRGRGAGAALISRSILERLGLSPDGVEAAPDEGCYLCRAEGKRCSLWELVGKVEHVQKLAQDGWLLRVRTELYGQASVFLSKPWDQLGDGLKTAVRSGIQPEVLFQHLEERIWNGYVRWNVDERSLVVVQPARKLDVSSVATIAECQMAYLVNHTSLDRPAENRVRGTIIHRAFELMHSGEQALPALERAGKELAVDLALAGVGEAIERDLLVPYAAKLRQLVDELGEQPLRLESSIGDDDLGLQGRIDVLVGNGPEFGGVVEVKSGKAASGKLPRPEHRRQVQLYGAMLWHAGVLALREASLKIAYLGGEKLDTVDVNFDWRAVRQALLARNSAALLDITGFPSRQVMCSSCPSFRKAQCDWLADAYGYGSQQSFLTSSDREFFRSWVKALLEEQAAAGDGLSGHRTVNRGTNGVESIEFTIERITSLETPGGGWSAILQGANGTRFRPGELAEISETGPLPRTETVEIVSVGDDSIQVSCDTPSPWATVLRPLRAGGLIRRQFQALDGWLRADERLRRLVEGSLTPRFRLPSPASIALDESQRYAAALVESAEDYALIWGPPGTGKTRTLAHIVAGELEAGRRVLISAMTNQAVENLLTAALGVRRGEALLLSRSPRDPNLNRYSLYFGDPDVAEASRRLREAPIVAATAHALSSGKFDGALQEGKFFDLAIVDEATQLTEPLALGAIRLARRFVLVGDHRQLSPIVQSGNALLSRSLFERFWMLPSAQGAKAMLKTQYRMAPEIAEFPSITWYGGELGSAPSTRVLPPVSAIGARRDKIWNEEFRQVFVDFAATGEAGKNGRDMLDLAMECVRNAVGSGVPVDEIGVIAAYRSQVATMLRMLDQDGVGAGVTVDTADRFQGAERDLMVVVLSPEGKDTLLHDERRLNVSFTRARRKLIVIGDSRALGEIPVLNEYIQFHRHHGTYLRADQHLARLAQASALPR